MYKMSELDKKIIYELGMNARQSYKKIAQKVRSSKEVIAYHITQLQKDGIITKFVPVISLTKLGIYSFKIYLKLHGLSETAENEFYAKLIANPQIGWIAKSTGQWDLLLNFYSSDIISFAQLKNKLLSNFSPYIAGYEITMIEDGIVLNRDYLIDKKTFYRKEFIFGGEKTKIELKPAEKKLLKLIRNDGRFQLVDISKKLNEDPRTTLAKIKKLEKIGIIQGYTTFLDLKKIGYQLHKLCIYLEKYEQLEIDKVIAYIKQNPFVIHITKALGSWELEIEMESDNFQFVYNYIKQIKNRFPEIIRHIDLATIAEETKLEFYPENL